MVDSKRIVRNIILGVISITIVWSFVNVSQYAKLYHDSWVVWSFGLVVAASNALSVYRFVESKSWTDRSPALVGVVLFGGLASLSASAVSSAINSSTNMIAPSTCCSCAWRWPSSVCNCCNRIRICSRLTRSRSFLPCKSIPPLFLPGR